MSWLGLLVSARRECDTRHACVLLVDHRRSETVEPPQGTDRGPQLAYFRVAVSGWEIGIKVKLGKWPEAAVLLPGLTRKVQDEGFTVLDLSLAQAERAGALDLVHRDPFDRMIAAQAIELDYAVATVDPVFEPFGCHLV